MGQLLKQAIESLKKQMDMFKAGEAHMQTVMEDKKIAVLSLYDGQRASHDILDDLVEWADATGNQELLDKIDDLAKL